MSSRRLTIVRATASAGERFLDMAMEQAPKMVRDAFSNTIRQGVTARPVPILSTRTRHLTGCNLFPGLFILDRLRAVRNARRPRISLQTH